MRRLDALAEPQAREALARCCGSHRWVEAMLARRPFGTREALERAASEIWFGLGREDWLEAFSHHPRIGDTERLRERFGASGRWSEGEQAGVRGAPEAVLEALAEGNRRYEQRFGWIFLICASGLDAANMLAALRERLRNDPETELRIAASEQDRITRLRLGKLLASLGHEQAASGPAAED
ncbi:MAG: 2-oxo-4-hydroxy-4-carboxy-5-ureidoimidazoline decarboxylase [Planctomycetota bacterium]|nr:MAG: 2-oxo-4-hydroxy-4-carboxy-5-ureidoimidazoline decarboxylase [Planctomycetota bacterium]